MQPSGEVGRFEVEYQPSPPADRNRSVLKTTHANGEPNTTRSDRKRNH
jgi:hypothetical protein